MRAKCLQSFVLSRQARSKAWEMLLNGVGIIAVLNGGQSGGRVVQMNRKGFTLIELLIVVVIIGILAAIAIPKFANTKGKAYIASMKSDLRNLVTAAEAFFADSVKYSTNVTSDRKRTRLDPTPGQIHRSLMRAHNAPPHNAAHV